MTQTSMALALAGFSFLLTVIWGAPLVRILRHFKLGKVIRVEGPNGISARWALPRWAA